MKTGGSTIISKAIKDFNNEDSTAIQELTPMMTFSIFPVKADLLVSIPANKNWLRII